MKALYAFILILLLAASAFAAPLSGTATGGGPIIVGTLADANNPAEMAMAPEYTRLAVVRQRTARSLNRLAASSETDPDRLEAALFSASAVQRAADEARAKLDGLAGARDEAAFRFALDEARDLIRRAETLCDHIAKGN